jgi:hypothetical protein
MDIPIPEFSREQIPRFPHEREIRSIDPDLFNPVPPALQSIWPMMKAIYQRTAPKEPEKTAPEPKSLPESPTWTSVKPVRTFGLPNVNSRIFAVTGSLPTPESTIGPTALNGRI